MPISSASDFRGDDDVSAVVKRSMPELPYEVIAHAFVVHGLDALIITNAILTQANLF